MAPIVLAGPQAIELHIIERCQPLSPCRVFPYPVLERLLDKLLLALGDGGLLLVQNGLFLPVLVLNIVKNPNIPLVQGFLNDLIGVDAPGSVGVGRLDTVFILGFPLDIPRPGDFGVVYLDIPLCVIGGVQQLKHELPYHIGGEPVCSQAHGNFTGGQVYRLHFFQCFHVGLKRRGILCGQLCGSQLLPHVTGEVFIGGLPALMPGYGIAVNVKGAGQRVFENNAPQILHDLRYLITAAHEGRHIA